MTPPRPLLRVENLTITFPTIPESGPVVDGVAFTVNAGERIALVGASGSGKSLTALALLGLTTPGGHIRTGRVEVWGTNILELGQPEQRRFRGRVLALIPQEAEASLNPVLSIASHFKEVLRSHRPGDRRRWDELMFDRLRAVDLANESFERRYPHELSGGQRQRVLIALALLTNPEIIIADEPTSSLDLLTQGTVLELLTTRCRERGVALIMITHDLEVAASTVERVMVMSAGRIVENGPVHSVMESPAHPYTKTLVGALPTAAWTVDDGRTICGCRDASSCPIAEDRCLTTTPELIQVGPGHKARCLLATKASS